MSWSKNGASKAIPTFNCHSEPPYVGTMMALFAYGKVLIINDGKNATTR